MMDQTIEEYYEEKEQIKAFERGFPVVPSNSLIIKRRQATNEEIECYKKCLLKAQQQFKNFGPKEQRVIAITLAREEMPSVLECGLKYWETI